MSTGYRRAFPQLRISNGFVEGGHSGIDEPAPSGAPIRSMTVGLVTARGTGWVMGYNYGHWLEYQGDDGVFVFHAHMKSPSLLEPGQPIGKPTVVGLVGATGGTLAQPVTGPHLHTAFLRESLHKSTVFDPQPYIAAHPMKEDEMQLIRHPNGTITTVAETTYQHHSPASYAADAKLLGPYLQLDDATYTQAIANTQVRKAYLLGAGSSVDAAAIAKAVEAQLADDFAALPALILDEQANRLEN